MNKYLKLCSDYIIESMQFINEAESIPGDLNIEELEKKEAELSDLLSKKRIEGTRKFTRPTGMMVDFRDTKGYSQYKKELDSIKKDLEKVREEIKNIKGDTSYKPNVGIDVKSELAKLKEVEPEITVEPEIEVEKPETIIETPKKESDNIYEIELEDGVYPAKWDGFNLSIIKNKNEISLDFDRKTKNPRYFNIRVLRNKFIFDPENNLNLGEREYTPRERSIMFGLAVPQSTEKEISPESSEPVVTIPDKKRRSRIEKFGTQVWTEKDATELGKIKDKIKDETDKKKRDEISNEIKDMFDEQEADEATGTDIGELKTRRDE